MTTMFGRVLDSYATSLDHRWRQIALLAACLTLAIALTDWYVVPNVALGSLYILPMLLVGMLPRRWTIPACGVLCSLLREGFSPFRWQPGYSTRLITTSAGFMAAAFTVSLLLESRREVAKHLANLQHEIKLRNAAETESHVIIDTSPVAILTTDEAGTVLMANVSAERLLKDGGSLLGASVTEYLSPIGPALSRGTSLRTEMECTGQRSTGETFLAHVWLSRYKTVHGIRAAIVVWDSSEELRSQQHAGLDGTLTASRLVIAGMAHEVRSLASAAEAVYRRLELSTSSFSADAALLGSLLSALGRLGAVGFTQHLDDSTCDLASALKELKVIVEPMFAEIDAEVVWPDMTNLPNVQMDHYALLQVMLNLARNAHRAIGDREQRRLAIRIHAEADRALIEFENTGPDISALDLLFQPFRSNSDSLGLGLYLSREMLRNAGGDLRCTRASEGACFVIEVPGVAQAAYDLA